MRPSRSLRIPLHRSTFGTSRRRRGGQVILVKLVGMREVWRAKRCIVPTVSFRCRRGREDRHARSPLQPRHAPRRVYADSERNTRFLNFENVFAAPFYFFCVCQWHATDFTFWTKEVKLSSVKTFWLFVDLKSLLSFKLTLWR